MSLLLRCCVAAVALLLHCSCCCVVAAILLLNIHLFSTFCQDCHNVWDPCCNSHHVDCTSHLLHDDLIVPSSVVIFVISPPCSTLILLLLLLVMTSVSRRTWRRRNGHCHNNAPFSGYSLSISPLLCTSPCNGCSRGHGTTSHLPHKVIHCRVCWSNIGPQELRASSISSNSTTGP